SGAGGRPGGRFRRPRRIPEKFVEGRRRGKAVRQNETEIRRRGGKIKSSSRRRRRRGRWRLPHSSDRPHSHRAPHCHRRPPESPGNRRQKIGRIETSERDDPSPRVRGRVPPENRRAGKATVPAATTAPVEDGKRLRKNSGDEMFQESAKASSIARATPFR